MIKNKTLEVNFGEEFGAEFINGYLTLTVRRNGNGVLLNEIELSSKQTKRLQNFLNKVN